MWNLIFGAFPSLITAAITAYNKSVDANVAKYKVDGTVNVAAIEAQAQLAQSQRDIIVAEQGHFLTRLPRPMMGRAVGLYVAKGLVWDKVLGFWTHGATDGVTGYTATIVGIIVAGYFLHETAIKWGAK